jgi:hypothetical protein
MDHRCLRDYRVHIPSDPRVGYPPWSVGAAISQLAAEIRAGIAGLDQAHRVPDAHLSPQEKLLNVVRFSCAVFELFLRIHPYADGNGHAARFILWAILGRYGYWPRRFRIEPKPDDVNRYNQSISLHRSGQPQHLEAFVLECIIG